MALPPPFAERNPDTLALLQDAHAKYNASASSASDDEPVARFNERFLLSLGACASCLVLDDELNVLPLSKGKDIAALDENASGKGKGKADDAELQLLRQEVRGTHVVSELVREAKTRDQALSILTLLDILSSSASSSAQHDLSTTVSLTAGRGRGKSAALGLSIAAAIAYGYSNIFVTSPAPSNLHTLFQFLLKGLDALGYKEVQDWEILRGPTGTELANTILRVNVFRNATSSSSASTTSSVAQGRQIVQYISPEDASILRTSSNAELVVIDEAAAIPLPLVRELMGQGQGGSAQYLVFLSSTINGYEGTGQSLSMKLLQQLRGAAQGEEEEGNSGRAAAVAGLGLDQEPGTQIKHASSSSSALQVRGTSSAIAHRRALREVSLQEPIRYSAGDHIERWLHELLCLDASLGGLGKKSSSKKDGASSAPHPSKCELYLVNRDALFSYHAASEAFLRNFMALYAASYYKNSPNDLQLMSDAPGQRLFVLLKPPSSSSTGVPEPLAIVQVALEGNISRQTVLNSLNRGTRETSDMIPWLLSNYFQDPDFAAELSGARVVRVAVHPDYARMGYGTRALELLRLFYKGQLLDADALASKEERESMQMDTFENAASKSKSKGGADLQKEVVSLRDSKRMPALLQRLSEQRPEQLDWIGASYGLTQVLFRFFSKVGYTPLYIHQAVDETSGEYNAVQLRSLSDDEDEEEGEGSWLSAFASDFRKRFLSLLSFRFRQFSIPLALGVLEAAADGSRDRDAAPLTPPELDASLSAFDLKRLEAYGNGLIEAHMVLDLFPALASFYFRRRLQVAEDGRRAMLKLSTVQAGTLLASGLQRKEMAEIAIELDLPVSQLLAVFNKAVRRIVQSLRQVQRKVIEADMPMTAEDTLKRKEPIAELAEPQTEHQQRQNELLQSMGLDEYRIQEGRDWSAAEKQVQRLASGKSDTLNTTMSVKGPQKEPEEKKRKVSGSSTKKAKKVKA